MVGEGLKVICATEDTTRTRPEFLIKIFKAGIAGGATELCVADTVGYAFPSGVEKQIRWIRDEIEEARDMYLHYHGHNDTGNSVSNTIAAIRTGGKIVGQGTWMGAGERTGNTPHEAILSSLESRGIRRYDISYSVPAAEITSEAFGIPIPRNHPLVGKIVFTYMTGIHTAGIVKAEQKGLPDVAGVVYSAVDPRRVNRTTKFNIGTLSGEYSVKAVIETINKASGLNLQYSDELAAHLINAAYAKNTDLSVEDVIRIAEENGNGHLVIE